MTSVFKVLSCGVPATRRGGGGPWNIRSPTVRAWKNESTIRSVIRAKRSEDPGPRQARRFRRSRLGALRAGPGWQFL